MRIVFCGSGSFAVPSLLAVCAADHELASVVTQPAHRAGRGGKVRHTPVSRAARDEEIEPWECPDVNAPEAVDRLADLGADVMVVADFGQFIHEPARGAVRRDAINLHASLLPALRGAAPINWAIIRRCRRTGVTTFSLVDAMDAGPIYVQLATDVRPGETAAELRERLAALGADGVLRTLDLLESGRAEAQPQDESKATLAPQLKKSDGRIDWSADANAVCALVCGTWPWPGAQTVLRRDEGTDVRLVIARAEVAENGRGDRPAGTLDDQLCVAAGNGRVRIREIQPAGKRRMSWQDFVNGYRPQPGDRFETPTS